MNGVPTCTVLTTFRNLAPLRLRMLVIRATEYIFYILMSQGSLMGLPCRLRDEDREILVRFPAGARDLFLFSKMSKPAVGPHLCLQGKHRGNFTFTCLIANNSDHKRTPNSQVITFLFRFGVLVQCIAVVIRAVVQNCMLLFTQGV
jgi:hypothetical protein